MLLLEDLTPVEEDGSGGKDVEDTLVPVELNIIPELELELELELPMLLVPVELELDELTGGVYILHVFPE